MKPGYKQTDVGVIPNDWDVVPLGRLITSVEYGSSAKSSLNGSVPVLRMGNLQNGKIDWSDLVYTNDAREIEKYSLRTGDVLFNRTNTIDLVGKTSIYLGEQPAVFAGYLIRVNVNKEQLDSHYLNYTLNTEVAKKYGLKILSVAVGQANINGQKLKTYPVPLPPTHTEQSAIATALGDIDNLLGALAALIEKKRAIKQGTMQELLTGNRRLPGFFGAWEVKALSQLLESPVTDGPHLTPRFLDRGVPFLSVNNLIDGKIDWSDLRYVSEMDHQEFSKKCRPQMGDILFGKAASVGKVAFVETRLEFNIWSPIALIRIDCRVSSRFVYHQLQSKFVERQVLLLTNSSSQGNIGMSDIERLQICLPATLDEQIAVAVVLDDLDTEIAALEAKRRKTAMLKQGMMQELLTGKTRLV